MSYEKVRGAVAGAALGVTSYLGPHIYDGYVLKSNATEALDNLPACENGRLSGIITSEKDITNPDFTQRFRCGGNIVVMSFSGADWQATRQRTTDIVHRPYVQDTDLEWAAVWGGLCAGLGSIFGAVRRNRKAVVISDHEKDFPALSADIIGNDESLKQGELNFGPGAF